MGWRGLVFLDVMERSRQWSLKVLVCDMQWRGKKPEIIQLRRAGYNILGCLIEVNWFCIINAT